MGIKVVLTGEGSDEHFGGYTDFRPDAIQEPDLSWPPSRFSDVERDTAWRETCENTGAIVFGDGILQVPKSTSRMANHTRTIRELAKIGGMPFAAWTDRYLSVGDPETLLAEAMDGRVRQMMATKWHPLHTSAYTWMKSFLVTFILRYCGDNIDMAHSVESRLPFLDHYLTEYANQLPPSLKMKFDPQTNSFREKYILREAVRPFVTEEVYNGRKKGYCGPTQYREGGPLHQTLQRLLTRENLEQLGFVHVPSSQKHLDSAFRQGDRTAFRNSMLIAQFVVLSQRFGVKPATPHSF
ncbi:asparagine synthase (glutamine-hydrolyzing) [Purpureocillium lavendulum]|uniref:Asparagine synthase (Glutamine-hydrolyzing) n=1 Tax=Purpureocillium lavendulum TaxID=1247861 RepID=A0AB34FK68_9HYPO|nr:asparagine synthase (glutamine-hydrolyzing) [Purpureocillium lavendulum]